MLCYHALDNNNHNNDTRNFFFFGFKHNGGDSVIN